MKTHYFLLVELVWTSFIKKKKKYKFKKEKKALFHGC